MKKILPKPMTLVDRVPEALRILTPNLDRLAEEFGHEHFRFIEVLLIEHPGCVDIPDIQREFLDLLLYITANARRTRIGGSFYMNKRSLEYVGMREIQTLKDVAYFHCGGRFGFWDLSKISDSSKAAIQAFTLLSAGKLD